MKMKTMNLFKRTWQRILLSSKRINTILMTQKIKIRVYKNLNLSISNIMMKTMKKLKVKVRLKMSIRKNKKMMLLSRKVLRVRVNLIFQQSQDILL